MVFISQLSCFYNSQSRYQPVVNVWGPPTRIKLCHYLFIILDNLTEHNHTKKRIDTTIKIFHISDFGTKLIKSLVNIYLFATLLLLHIRLINYSEASIINQTFLVTNEPEVKISIRNFLSP